MEYIPLFEVCPELAERELTVMKVDQLNHPLDGDYTVIESYCAEPDCDCRRVFLILFRKGQREPLATIAYGWESKPFYRRWLGWPDEDTVADLKGPVLNLMSRQSEMAPMLLALVRMHLLNDKAFMARIKRHYRACKAALPAA